MLRFKQFIFYSFFFLKISSQFYCSQELDDFEILKKPTQKELDEDLLESAKKLDILRVKQVLQAGANINAQDSITGDTAYHTVIKSTKNPFLNNQASSIRGVLILHNANETIPNNEGITVQNLKEKEANRIIQPLISMIDPIIKPYDDQTLDSITTKINNLASTIEKCNKNSVKNYKDKDNIAHETLSNPK